MQHPHSAAPLKTKANVWEVIQELSIISKPKFNYFNLFKKKKKATYIHGFFSQKGQWSNILLILCISQTFITESWNNSGWKEPQEISSPTSCSKQGQPWSQTRLLRPLSSQVFQNLQRWRIQKSSGPLGPPVTYPRSEKSFLVPRGNHLVQRCPVLLVLPHAPPALVSLITFLHTPARCYEVTLKPCLLQAEEVPFLRPVLSGQALRSPATLRTPSWTHTSLATLFSYCGPHNGCGIKVWSVECWLEGNNHSPSLWVRSCQ